MTTDIADAQRARSRAGFGWGALIGVLGGLIGLGGAEFRLPVSAWWRRCWAWPAASSCLIPTITLLYGLDIKLAGSLSLVLTSSPA